ncbi:MAG: hypothetical protein Q7T57_08670 [Dehalococcoidales bacterium]|nr:hypothetical protein [Dehalococcoidales bacterium]
MVKIISPLLSFDASGNLGDRITFSKRHRHSIAEKIAQPADAKTQAQLSWRTMFEKCTLLWHSLSAAEKATWERLGTARHMTGYALWQSQCLRPNPGIYLPLAGGTMTGNVAAAPGVTFDGVDLSELTPGGITKLSELTIDVDKDWQTHLIKNIGDPTANQDAVTKAWYLANLPAGGYTQGARVYNNAPVSINNTTFTILSFNSERFDTDNIHESVTNPSRLTCMTAGKYLIIANISWAEANYTVTIISILLNGTTLIAREQVTGATTATLINNVTTVYYLALNDYIQLQVYQYSAGAHNVNCSPNYSPEFMMQRIG